MAVGLWLLIFIMMDSILLENVVDKIYPNLNGYILIIDGNKSGFGEYNNLLSSLKRLRYQKNISYNYNKIVMARLGIGIG